MSSSLFVMDSRVPVDPHADRSDPNHPENVTKRALMLQRQANADSTYDSKVPIREHEGFESPLLDTIDVRIRIAFFLVVAAAAIAAATCVQFKLYKFELRIACAVIAIGAIHYAVALFK